jgi:UDP-N-acetylenolpyruvoylglucosamine reductase
MRWRDFDNLSPLPDEFFDLEKFGARHVHFIGIGGIGMSALAFVLKSRGHLVSGSDANESTMLDRLRAAGILCAVGHSTENLNLLDARADAVIFGSAISEANPEYAATQKQNIPLWHRAQLLAYFANNAKFSVAVSGTHGKSTTSAMIAHILEACGKNPTAILGAEYPPFNSNAHIGDANLVVVEADESDGSFTLLHPTIAVVTNVEPEHLENYDHDESELWRAFEQFLSQANTGVLNADTTLMFERLSEVAKLTVPYALKAGSVPVVGVPGEHNQSNALAAITACEVLGMAREQTQPLLQQFCGVKRRFQKIGEAGGVTIYDDYAHHPTEVASTLRAARDFLKRPVTVIFQPHRYSRTQHLGRDFGPSFEAADKVIITQLYSAFEEPIEGVSGRIVFDAARAAFPEKEIHYAENLEEARTLALQIVSSGDTLFTMGAGDITRLAPQLLEDLKNHPFEIEAPSGSNHKSDELLAKHTTMKIGGAARIWLEPQSAEELAAMLKWTAQRGLPLFVLGAGSNVIATDSGFEGAVLHLGKGFETRRIEEERMIVGGATLLPKLTHFALDHDLGNFEWACGVPGSVGGSIWGNAGARGWNGRDFESRDCAADLESLEVFERNGTRRILSRDDIEFSYRKSSLGEMIVTQATFALKKLSCEETLNHRTAVKELLARRKASQPVSAACAGCIWKNPQIASGEYSGCGAGALIEALGMKGLRIGGAQISEIHGNFIVNTGNASATDVFALIERVEEEVLRRASVKLEREVRILGI